MKKVSIIIPVRVINNYIREHVPRILELDYPDFEVLILPNEKSGEAFGEQVKVIPTGNVGPAEKRDLGVEHASGEILAFIDDDAYPRKDWLKNAVLYFKDNEIAGVCGPGVTPPENSVLQKAGGWVSAALLGGGNVTHRFIPQEKREVDDYPSMNLIIRRSDYEAVGGYDSHFWPGEDTKLCLDLVHNLGKKIIYDPDVVVYHHRRPLFIPHLKQNGRYGLHRGHFARVLPETSRRIAYFVPSMFVLGLIGAPFLILLMRFIPGLKVIRFHMQTIYYSALFIYGVLLLITAGWVFSKEKDWQVALLTVPGIFATHVWYGVQFIRGLLKKELKR